MLVSTPDFASEQTRQALDDINRRWTESSARAAAAQAAAEQAKTADPLTADVDQLILTRSNLVRATVDHLREQIAIRRKLAGLLGQLESDRQAALSSAQQLLAQETAEIEQGLVKLGFGPLLLARGPGGMPTFDIRESTILAPIANRLAQLRVDDLTGTINDNKHELNETLRRLQAAVDKAAGEPAEQPPARTVGADVDAYGPMLMRA